MDKKNCNMWKFAAQLLWNMRNSSFEWGWCRQWNRYETGWNIIVLLQPFNHVKLKERRRHAKYRNALKCTLILWAVKGWLTGRSYQHISGYLRKYRAIFEQYHEHSLESIGSLIDAKEDRFSGQLQICWHGNTNFRYTSIIWLYWDKTAREVEVSESSAFRTKHKNILNPKNNVTI